MRPNDLENKQCRVLGLGWTGFPPDVNSVLQKLFQGLGWQIAVSGGMRNLRGMSLELRGFLLFSIWSCSRGLPVLFSPV